MSSRLAFAATNASRSPFRDVFDASSTSRRARALERARIERENFFASIATSVDARARREGW
jgi:hypothetical protein